jgi:methanogenic corrinoid protein MtbC1
VNRPQVLALSLAMPSNMMRVKRLIELVRQEPGFGASKVILGGNLLRSHPELWRTLGADAFAEEAEGAIPILDGWCR